MPPSQQLQSILDRIHRREPPFQRPAFDLERHLLPSPESSSSPSNGDHCNAVEHAMERIVHEEILCDQSNDCTTTTTTTTPAASPASLQLDDDFLQFVLHMGGPGTLANAVRIFAPLPAGDPSPLANMQFHTSRIRDRYRTLISSDTGSSGSDSSSSGESMRRPQLAHTFPIDRLLVFARHTQEPIWFAFGTMLDDPQLRSHVFALHENLERSPPPVVVSRSGFIGFLRRVCRLPGNDDSDDDSDDDDDDGDFMEGVLDHFRISSDDDNDDSDSDVNGVNGTAEEEGENALLEFRPFADIIR